MPVYEYICSQCQNHAELLVPSFSAKPACPECGSKKMDRQLSVFAAHIGAKNRTPCTSGACPSTQGSSCASGKCPFSG